MKTIWKAVKLIPLLILWLMLSIFLWGFVFNLITDAPAAEKITLYVDAEMPGATQLAVQLEETLGGKARMVKVRPFDYAMFDSAALTGADLFIVPASHAETYQEWFRPLPDEVKDQELILEIGGTAYGIRAYNAADGTGIAKDCIQYTGPNGVKEDYYLFFGQSSIHISGNENAVDNTAVDAARCLFDLYTNKR